MIYSWIKVKNKPQTLGWFDTQNDYKISMKLKSIYFNIGNRVAMNNSNYSLQLCLKY